MEKRACAARSRVVASPLVHRALLPIGYSELAFPKNQAGKPYPGLRHALLSELLELPKDSFHHNKGKNNHPLGFDNRVIRTTKRPPALGKFFRWKRTGFFSSRDIDCSTKASRHCELVRKRAVFHPWWRPLAVNSSVLMGGFVIEFHVVHEMLTRTVLGEIPVSTWTTANASPNCLERNSICRKKLKYTFPLQGELREKRNAQMDITRYWGKIG